MSMNRVIHSAIRRDLRRFDRALTALEPGDRDRAAALGRAWDNFRFQLDHHHHSEHDIVWPALTSYGVDPALLEQMDAEHGLMAAALGEAHEAMTGLREDPSAARRDRALGSIQHLQHVTVSHLEHEERELEPVLVGGFETSPEATVMDKQLRAGGLGRAATMLAWVSDDAGPEETRTLRALLPPPLRLLLVGLLGRRYRRQVSPAWR